MMAGANPSVDSSPASASACISDSEGPVKHTSDAPVFGRSQMSTRPSRSASRSASWRIPGVSLLKRPPGVTTQARRPSPITS